jgi:hypothetical protein
VLSVKYAFFHCGFPVVDLPRCSCGGDFVDLWVDVEVEGRQVVLVGHPSCGDCGFEPAFSDCGTDSASWRDAMLRCANAWSVSLGGIEYPRIALLPDQLDEMVGHVEDYFGPLPEYRAKVMAKHVGRRLI